MYVEETHMHNNRLDEKHGMQNKIETLIVIKL